MGFGNIKKLIQQKGTNFGLKNFFFLVLTGFFCLSGILGWVTWDLFSYAKTSAAVSAPPHIIEISSGQNLEITAEVLERTGVIRKPEKFKLLARVKMLDRRIKAGEYRLSATMTPLEILKIMTEGKVFLYKITIPEGYNVHQIASVLQKKGLVSKADFVRAAEDISSAQKVGIDARSFEGFLFPETYFFEKDVSPEAIIHTMVERFHMVFEPIWERRPADFPFTVFETVILASLIEKETGLSSERPLISSVFHNRIRKNMKLESDPTVIYGIEDFDGNLTRKHLRMPTDYNTYTQKGLPAGPITNPGAASLEAAIFPASTPYLYFVSKNDNSHHFSTTYEQHRKAVRNYQLRKN